MYAVGSQLCRCLLFVLSSLAFDSSFSTNAHTHKREDTKSQGELTKCSPLKLQNPTVGMGIDFVLYLG